MAVRTHEGDVDPHVDPDVTPDGLGGCVDRLGEGSSWTHLRNCLACGHVGCGHRSAPRHATARFHRDGHLVVRSVEPDEPWRSSVTRLAWGPAG